MALLTKDRKITEKGVRALFVQAYVTMRRALVYPRICQVVDSHVEKDWARTIGMVPQLEEVISDVNGPGAADFPDFYWEWYNRLYQSRIFISRDVMAFDQTGQVRTLLHSMAARLANFPDLLFFTRLANDSFYSGEWSGTSAAAAIPVEGGTGYQIPLFSTMHLTSVSGTGQSNLLTGSTPTDFCTYASVTSVAEQIKTDFRRAIAQLRTFRDNQGQPWHYDDIKPEDLVVICGPLLQTPMEQAFFSGTMNATDNVLKGKVREILSSNYLPATGVGAADWWLLHVGRPQRPFMYSRFREIRDEEIEDFFGKELIRAEGVDGKGVTLEDLKEFSSVQIETNLNKQGFNADPDVAFNNRFFVQCRWRGEMMGGVWQNAIKMDNSAT